MTRITKTLGLLLIASSAALSQSNVITDPTQITSKSKFDIKPFTVEKLYMTRAVGDSAW